VNVAKVKLLPRLKRDRRRRPVRKSIGRNNDPVRHAGSQTAEPEEPLVVALAHSMIGERRPFERDSSVRNGVILNVRHGPDDRRLRLLAQQGRCKQAHETDCDN